MMTERTPRISMSYAAHYVTQTSVYDSPRLGPLTDRKIRKYEKAGYYGKAAKERALHKEKARVKKILLEFVV